MVAYFKPGIVFSIVGRVASEVAVEIDLVAWGWMMLLRFELTGFFILLFALLSSCGKPTSNEELYHSPSIVNGVPAIKIGSFNLLRLGQVPKDSERMAKLINKAEYHIFAGIEIMDQASANNLLAKLREETSHDWQLILSSVPSGESTYKEFFGYFYRNDVVTPIDGHETFCNTSEGVDVHFAACFAKDHGSGNDHDFERDPFIGHFKVGRSEFSLVSVHLVYGGEEQEAVKRRQRELSSLKEVMKKVRSSTPQADVLAVGDFNLTLADDSSKSSKKMPKEFFSEAPSLGGLIKGATTVGMFSYDHILFFNDNKHLPIPGSEEVILDFDINDAKDRTEYKKAVSDHFPVAAVLGL